MYLLLGPSEDPSHEARAYVGEAEDPRTRIDHHHANKDFWTRLVLFTSAGQMLNKATLRYVEARLLELAAAAQRAELDNGTAPALPPLSEAEIDDAEAFVRDMLVIYPILGVPIFEPLEQPPGQARLYLEGPAAHGEGIETDDGFLVFAGALARVQELNQLRRGRPQYVTL